MLNFCLDKKKKKRKERNSLVKSVIVIWKFHSITIDAKLRS